MGYAIFCAGLIREVDAKLLELLASLRPEEWDLQTVAPEWKVRDVAGTHSDEDLVTLVNRLNREGVAFYGKLSPAILISLMAVACGELAEFHEALNPFALAAFAVSWAAEDKSLNWFDTARELTERWHHQQQIRLATGRPGIMTRALYRPVLDCFMRG